MAGRMPVFNILVVSALGVTIPQNDIVYYLAYGLFIEHYDPTEEPTTRILRVANDTQVALEVSKQTQFQLGEDGWYTSTKRHEICRAAEGIIFVYDLCHPHSPENVRRLYDLVMEEREEWQFANGKTHRGLLMGGRWADEERLLTSGLATKRPVPIGIVALGAERDPVDIAVSVEERERLARGLGGFTVDCSAEDGSGLEEVFMGVVEGVMEQREQRRRLMEERHSLLF
ncbi:Ras GTPase ras2 [Onygenales sp. PD_40]|nr:Ras GTPase ras2 [Onygenales sp. PD_40]